jgi:hypothetical protein
MQTIVALGVIDLKLSKSQPRNSITPAEDFFLVNECRREIRDHRGRGPGMDSRAFMQFEVSGQGIT